MFNLDLDGDMSIALGVLPAMILLTCPGALLTVLLRVSIPWGFAAGSCMWPCSGSEVCLLGLEVSSLRLAPASSHSLSR